MKSPGKAWLGFFFPLPNILARGKTLKTVICDTQSRLQADRVKSQTSFGCTLCMKHNSSLILVLFKAFLKKIQTITGFFLFFTVLLLFLLQPIDVPVLLLLLFLQEMLLIRINLLVNLRKQDRNLQYEHLSVRILVIIPQLLLPIGTVPILRDVSVILGMIQVTRGRCDSCFYF